MPDRNPEAAFTNPLPPEGSHHHHKDEDDTQPLTNEDFRKLMMTPRAPSQSSSQSHSFSSSTSSKHREVKSTKTSGTEEDDPAARRRKKKIYYAKLKKMEEEREKELAEKYRDRAKERRDGLHNDEGETVSTTADYRSVAPDAKIDHTIAERRKQVIQESKYLGGDMEHTHLVKGLDYALLEKVRAEITSKETEEQQMELLAKDDTDMDVVDEDVQKLTFRTAMARNIYKTVFQPRYPERNDLFLPGRMAYVIDLEDEFGDSDVPCTSIRSKADCPTLESTTTLTTNDIVISKLTQILSYLRQGKRDSKKLKKKDKGKHKEDHLKSMDDNIYGDQDIGDYMPSYSKSKKDKRSRHDEVDKRGSRSDKDRGRDGRDKGYDRYRRSGKDYDKDTKDKKRSYFEKPVEEEEEQIPTSTKAMVSSINEKFSKGWAPADLERETALNPDQAAPPKPTKESESIKRLKKLETDSYAECYPGMMESADAIDDSDEEVDYTKMDHGNKKGPVGRWDFDTQEEYSDYMSQKEALPKAAFQYGVKMSDGRKTRRADPKDKKAQLDREWQKIQGLISKRKAGDDGREAKYPKY